MAGMLVVNLNANNESYAQEDFAVNAVHRLSAMGGAFENAQVTFEK